MKKKLLVFALTVLGVIVMLQFAGCKEKNESPVDVSQMEDQTKEAVEVADAAIEQTICPMMGNPIDKSVFVEYEGKKVYFCCPGCEEKFNADPEKYVKDLPQF